MSEIKIGDYTLTVTVSGQVWLSRKGGEAMQMNEATLLNLEIYLEQFWNENF